MYQRILVPTDDSTLLKKAGASAIEQAATTGAELVALYVVPRCPLSYFEGPVRHLDGPQAQVRPDRDGRRTAARASSACCPEARPSTY